mgnify:CR=1 FL=1
MFARLKPYFKPEKADYRLITESTRELVKKYRNDSDLRFFISGPAIVNDSFREVSDKDMTTMLPITILIIFFILFLSFKNLYSVLLTLSVVATSIPATMALAGYLNITFNELVFTVPGIMLAICIADCVHILNSFYQKKRQGFENKDSLIFSLRKNILPTFMTSLTTFIGFISLTNTGLVPVQSLGLLAAIGTVYAWIFTLFFMSPLILFLPEWGHRLLFTQKKEILIFSSEKWFSFIKNYQYSIITFFVILFGFGLFFGLKNEVNSNPYKYFRDKVPVKIANDFFVDTLGGNQGPQLVIETTPDGITEPEFLRKVEKLHLWMEELDYVDNVISLIDVIKQLNKSLHNDDPRFYTIPDTKEAVAQLLLLYSMSLPQGKGIEDLVTFQYDTLKLTLMWSQQNTKEAAEALQVIETKIKEFGLNGYTSGKIPLFINMNTYIVSTFFNSMASAFILVTIFLIFLFRSVYLGLLSLLPNIIPLAIGSAIMYFWGKPIDVGTALVASICLGIAVDDTIHFLLNYFQFLKEETSENALKKTFEVTGKALIYTTVILVCGFGAFVMGDFIPNVNFGVMSAIVLTIALLTDLIFLPALILRKAIN